VVLSSPVPAEVSDADARPVTVTGRGLLTAPPALVSVEGGPWEDVVAWAGPWPASERWWSSRRRRARLQVVTAPAQVARLLVAERGRWWVEAVYD
jgi:protein ImuB